MVASVKETLISLPVLAFRKMWRTVHTWPQCLRRANWFCTRSETVRQKPQPCWLSVPYLERQSARIAHYTNRVSNSYLSRKSFHPYIEEIRFTTCTHHEALRWVFNMTEPTGKLARRRLRMSECDIVIARQAWIKHHVADTLLRLNTKGEYTFLIEIEVTVLTVPRENLDMRQRREQSTSSLSRKPKTILPP